MIGTTLGHYRILDLLGAGGMGEVYRAEDTVLGREVALKVLPEEFTSDRERLARFEREAKVLATLDHPNIASVYAFEEDRNVHFLVMQLADGETLAERISRGAMPVEEALAIVSQIALALESAHERGIIHRDLKPANIKVDVADRVRVLDFGLAKALRAAEPALEGSLSETLPLSESRTLTAEMTSPGIVMGTAAYMSPEQARGKPLDRRVDIWAFGCVLYEMLTGRKAFPGVTATDSLARILERDPDWEALPRETPALVRQLLGRCLAKDPRYRFRDMGDVWLEVAEVSDSQSSERLTNPTAWRWVIPSAVVALVLGLALGGLLPLSDREATPRVSKYPLATRPLALGPHPVSPLVALSRDGRVLVYLTGGEDRGRIRLRQLDSFDEITLAGTEGAQAPFFSPDGSSLGFAADGMLKVVSVEDGATTMLCEVDVMHGAVWGPDNRIIFSGAEGLYRIPAAGGEPELLITEEVGRTGEVGHHSPDLVPGRESVIFGAVGSNSEPLELALVDLRTGERKSLIEGGGQARVLPSGHLVYSTGGKLMAAEFDLESLEVVGEPIAVLSELMMGFPMEPDLGHYAISDNGTLVYVAGPPLAGGMRWVWVDRAGTPERTGQSFKFMLGPKISPDGTKLVVSKERWNEKGAAIWIEDLNRGTLSRLTYDSEGWWPLWSPDGQRFAFSSWDGGNEAVNIFTLASDGSGMPERVTRGNLWRQSSSWTRDGEKLLFHRSRDPETGFDVLEVEPGGEGEPRVLLGSTVDELQPHLSPDDEWLAYVSNETGRNEVYVRRYPDLTEKWQISNRGGTEPLWSPAGDELFYRQGPRIMVVELGAGELSPSRPRELFEARFAVDVPFGRGFDVAPDGQGFVFIEQADVRETEHELRVVVGWLDEIEAILAGEIR